MNKRQRYFSEVNRLMGVGGRVHQRAFIDPATLATPAFKPVKVGEKTFDLNATIEIVDPKVDVQGYLAALQYNAQQAHESAKTLAAKAEVLDKVEAQLTELFASQKKMAEEVVLRLTAVPSGKEAADGKAKLFGVHLSAKPDQFDNIDQKLKVNAAFGGMSDLQVALLHRSDVELGIEDAATQKKRVRWQYLSDEIGLWVKTMARRNPEVMLQLGWKAHPRAQEFVRLSEEFSAAAHEAKLVGPAMNETNATEGANWVPGAILSSRIYPFIEMEYALAGCFENISMPGPIYDSPVVASMLESVLLNENILDDGTSTGATIPPSYWQTGKFTLTAKMHAVGVVVSPAWMQDQVAGADIVLRQVAAGIGRGREQWMVNGQVTGQIDSALTLTSPDIRLRGDGLRYWYSLSKAAGIVSDIDAGGGLTAELLAKAIGQGGAYAYPSGQNMWLTSTAGSAQLLVLKTSSGQSVVLTDEVYGAQATFRTGSIGRAFGRDILVSSKVSETMDANGLVDVAPNDRTVILHFNTGCIKRGERAGMVVDYSDQARFFQYQECYRAVAREDFTRVYNPATQPFIQQLVNVKKF